MEHHSRKPLRDEDAADVAVPGWEPPAQIAAGAGVLRCTAFLGDRLWARGSIESVSRRVSASGLDPAAVRVFEDETGRLVQLVTRRRATGRPRLGVEERTAMLLPRHWAWLARQPGGASAAIRQLVDRAWREAVQSDPCHHVADALGEFTRSLQSPPARASQAVECVLHGDWTGAKRIVWSWAPDVRCYALALFPRAQGGDGPLREPSPGAYDQKFCS